MDGYGTRYYGGKSQLAHRVAYCEHNNMPFEDIDGMEVRHICDNPPCVNPKHLEIGTHAENMADMQKRGRSASGERNGSAKLSRKDVESILLRISDGETQQELAIEFSVSKTAMSNLATGVKWAEFSEGTRSTVPPGRVGERNGRAKLNEGDVREIRRLHSIGNSQATIAATYGVSQVAVSKITRRVSWPGVI